MRSQRLDARVITTRVEMAPARDERAERALDRLAAEYAAGNIIRSEWESARRAVERPVVEARVEPPTVVAGDGFEPRLSLAVERIVVGRSEQRGPRVDLSRVHIVWRA